MQPRGSKHEREILLIKPSSTSHQELAMVIASWSRLRHLVQEQAMTEPKILVPGTSNLTKEVSAPLQPRPKQNWRDKFRIAFRGMKWGIRGQSSFFVHFFLTAAVIATAIVLDCTLIQWCLLVVCIGMVLTAELFNSAIETLFKGLEHEGRERCWRCLDIAAGAVLMASITATIIGTLIFTYQLGVLLEWSIVQS